MLAGFKFTALATSCDKRLSGVCDRPGRLRRVRMPLRSRRRRAGRRVGRAGRLWMRRRRMPRGPRRPARRRHGCGPSSGARAWMRVTAATSPSPRPAPTSAMPARPIARIERRRHRAVSGDRRRDW